MTDVNGFNELFFDANENALEYFKSRGYNLCSMARSNQEGPKNWSYRTDTYADNEYLFFRCTDSIPSFEVSMGRDKSGKLKVHNVVPLDRDQIDAQQYNVLLDKFRKAIIDPYNKLAPSIFRLPIEGESNTELDGESNTEPNADEIAFEFFNDDLVAVKKSAISTLELITDGNQISFDRKEDTDFDFSYNIREYKIVLDKHQYGFPIGDTEHEQAIRRRLIDKYKHAVSEQLINSIYDLLFAEARRQEVELHANDAEV